ncbi:MAG: protecting protein DprA protein [Candidatus Amesbacteria bacterium GW2011_GWB1_48_13]|uniref:Protecting protein DprA protein n=1 Tax=Candidatus Amesbacteria bacterium GW2011_GWB1_48_13 TaxID=1618362 RepID=A0A0G1UT85_9BACT|nr:MAG: protecting protein DprA protein [Candidatus Amesbacteria bacterium GW2011_GWB1_48_13]
MANQFGSIEGKKVKGLADLGSRCPKKLWFRGNWDDKLFENAAAIIGSRRMTDYGRKVTEKMAAQLTAEGKTIVSGLVYGVDQTVHRACLEFGGRTVAVLGWGIGWDKLGDEEKKLIESIEKNGGLVISEWEGMRPALWTFAYRDRIMAAMASEIYVAEAAVKSGTMITVEWGLKLGREIWAVPGPVTSKVSEGTNKLISEGKARMWMYISLQNETLTVDELARKLGKPVEEVGGQLSLLELSGEVEEREGKYSIINILE